MPQPRYRLVHPQTTPYYHCISRCVRRALLCGFDSHSNKNFDHRKQWILDRIKVLSSIFAIEVCAYAIMSNHFHLVLCINTEQAKNWSDEEVIDRWLTLYNGPPIAQKYQTGQCLTPEEKQTLDTFVNMWRERLSNLSWYMRCLNETVARMANAEDDCTGRFWEGRFRSQALLDNAALISCMAYVDLNPIRASMSDSIEGSEFTSIQERLNQFCKSRDNISTGADQEYWLKPLPGEPSQAECDSLPLQLTDYLALVDWTGRAVRQDKRGSIPNDIRPILQRLGVNQNTWVDNTQHFGNRFRRALGRASRIQNFADVLNLRWIQGKAQINSFYG